MKHIIILLFIIASNPYRGDMFGANFRARQTVLDAVVTRKDEDPVTVTAATKRNKMLLKEPPDRGSSVTQ